MKPCKLQHTHTKQPEGYMNFHNWAKEKAKAHKQIRCAGCKRFMIWIPKNLH